MESDKKREGWGGGGGGINIQSWRGGHQTALPPSTCIHGPDQYSNTWRTWAHVMTPSTEPSSGEKRPCVCGIGHETPIAVIFILCPCEILSKAWLPVNKYLARLPWCLFTYYWASGQGGVRKRPATKLTPSHVSFTESCETGSSNCCTWL